MGTIIRSKDFSRLRKLKDEWEGLCSGCREQTPDTIEHQILECKGFENIRERHLQQMTLFVRSIFPNDWRNRMLSFILEGNLRFNLPSTIVMEWRKKTLDFLKAFTKERLTYMNASLK